MYQQVPPSPALTNVPYSNDDLPQFPQLVSMNSCSEQINCSKYGYAQEFANYHDQSTKIKTDYFSAEFGTTEEQVEDEEEDIFFPQEKNSSPQLSSYNNLNSPLLPNNNNDNNNFQAKQEYQSSHQLDYFQLDENNYKQQQDIKIEEQQQYQQQQQYYPQFQIKQEENIQYQQQQQQPIFNKIEVQPQQTQINNNNNNKMRNPKKSTIHNHSNRSAAQLERVEYRKIKKNFLKNYCSAFLHHIQKAKESLGPVLAAEGIEQNAFFTKYLPKKNKVNNQIMFKELFSIALSDKSIKNIKQMQGAYEMSKSNYGMMSEEQVEMAYQFEQLLKEKKVLRKFALKFFRQDVVQYCMFSARIKNVFQFLKLKYEFMQNLMNLNEIEKEMNQE